MKVAPLKFFGYIFAGSIIFSIIFSFIFVLFSRIDTHFNPPPVPPVKIEKIK